MKRQLTSIMLFSALLVGGASTFVSCTDHESDSAYNTSLSLADAIAKEKQALIDITNTLETKADHAADKEALERRIQENKDLIDGLDNKFNTAFGQYASLDAAVSASKAYTDEKIESAKDELNAAIEELRSTDDQARQQLETSLLEKITANGEAIANEADARQQLEDNYDMAFDFLINKNLNNIAINATENPVLGYFNAAFVGTQLNLAASFYGTASQTSQDWGIKSGELLNDENAGKIYVSLNPTEIDPACITSLKLVDSQGNEAKGSELGQLQNTDKVLTYGVSRAVAEVSSNGFYAIPVKATDPANDDFSLNKGELKEAAKNVLAKLQNPKETNLNLSQIGTALYSSVNNQLKAYTVKAEYYLWNPETKKFVKKTQVAPTYNMAAFAVKPLSFNTLKDNETLKKVGVALDKYLIPTMSDKLGKIMSALDVNIELSNDNKTINVYTIVALTDVTAAKDETTGSVWFYKNGSKIEGSEIKNADIETVTTTDVEGHTQNVYKISTTDNTIANVVADLNNQLGDQLQPVKDAITNAATKWDNAITPVNNLLKKINAHISDVNQLLQPTMLYKSTKTNSWNTLSTLKGKLGTRMTGTGSTVLVATSWTGELLAPAYKKSVYVKEAGAKVTLMDGTSAKTPFAGSVQKVLFTAEKAGNYTVVYKAVDYSGVETTKEYHITVE